MKKLTFCLVAALAAGFASASELYWQLNEASKLDGDEELSFDNVVYATLYRSNNGLSNSSSDTGNNFALQKVAYNSDNIGETFITDQITSSDSSRYFFVELTTAGGERVASTDLVAYSALTDYIYNGGMATPPSSPYTGFSGFTAEVIPEPSSGLLVLLGMMALGLKRKRV